MEFTESELATLRQHNFAIYRGKLILEAQPPVTNEALETVRDLVDGEIPNDLLDLWRTAFGGALDYDLQVAFGEREYAVSFTELFYPDSSHYNDLIGWIEHELELACEVEESEVERLPIVPFGGFEYLERMYCVTVPREFGSVYLWAQGLPPAWKMHLTEDSLSKVCASVSELFDLLSLDADPWMDSNDRYAHGLEMKRAIEELVGEHPSLAAKLKQLVRSSVFDWNSVIDNNDLAPPHEPTIKRALMLAVERAVATDDPHLLERLMAKSCPLQLRIQDKATILPFALAQGAHRVAAAALASGAPLADDPIVYAPNASAELIDALIGRGAAFDAAAPISVASSGNVDSALRIALEGNRFDPEEWRSVGKDIEAAAERARKNAADVRTGKLGSSLTPDDYLAQAEHLSDLARRLPKN